MPADASQFSKFVGGASTTPTLPLVLPVSWCEVAVRCRITPEEKCAAARRALTLRGAFKYPTPLALIARYVLLEIVSESRYCSDAPSQFLNGRNSRARSRTGRLRLLAKRSHVGSLAIRKFDPWA